MSPRSNETDPLPYLSASAGKPSHGRRYHDPDIDICWAPDHCRRTAVSLSVLKYASNLFLRHRGGHIVNADSDCAMAGQIQGPYYKTFLSDGTMTDAPGNIGMSPKNTELKCCTGRNDAPQHGQWSGHSNGKAHASASLFLLIWVQSIKMPMNKCFLLPLVAHIATQLPWPGFPNLVCLANNQCH